MHLALGADHAGYALKEQVKHLLDDRQIAYKDFGTLSNESVDYPDFAAQVGRAVASGLFTYGILVCGSGIGMAIAANKIAGIRAASIVDLESAGLCRAHNNANVLALGARVTLADLALRIVGVFLDTAYEGGRHDRRLAKIAELEHAPAGTGESRPEESRERAQGTARR